MNNYEDKLTEKICKVLDQSLEDLDPATTAKLSRLKYQALHPAGQKKKRSLIWSAVPVTVVLLLIVLFNVPEQRQAQMPAPGLAELGLLTSPESLDFYAEDIEFYEWLSEVMEDELELSGQHTAVPANSAATSPLSTGNRRSIFTQHGTYRVSGGIRG